MNARLSSLQIAATASEREKSRMLRQMVADAESAKKLHPYTRIERIGFLLAFLFAMVFGAVIAQMGRRAWIALVALLSGCASSYWVPNPAFSDFEPRDVQIVYTDDLSPCASPTPVIGCAVRVRQSRTCYAYVKASMPLAMRRCVAMHEARHCIAGEDHEVGKPNYAMDCGNGELHG